MSNPRREKGITLVETLVALAILAFTALATLLLIGQNTRFAVSALEKTYAGIAADNAMVEILATSRRLDQGVQTQNYELQGYEWTLRQTVSGTGIENLLRIDVEILDPDDEQVITAITTLKSVS